MKQVIKQRLLIAAIALLTVPSLVFAQKAQKKKEEKEKKEFKQIIITRTGDSDEKMVIEVEGDKITINGKDVKELKDVNVNVNTMNDNGVYRFNRGGETRVFDFDFDHDNYMSLFSEDENRAMLGVVTEGHEKGAEINSITKESAAEKAGLQKGDIITRIGERKIESTGDVTEAIHSKKPGDKIEIAYLRDGKENKTSAELGKWKGIKMNAVSIPRISGMGNWNDNPDVPRIMNQYGHTFSVGGKPKLGLSIQDTEDGTGVKVLEVEEESNAAKAGFQEDDIIIGIDEKEVKGTEDVTRTLRENHEKYTFNFKIKRGNKTQTLEVKMPRKLKTAEL